MPLRPLLATLLAMTTLPVHAADVLIERNMSLSLAVDAAQAAVQFCQGKGWNVSAAVVDRAGVLKAELRADGAGPHTIAAARDKAFTSASARNATTAMLDAVQKNPPAATLPMIEGFLVLGGGVPIKVGDEVIGAIGVGGAPAGPLDETCAQAGIAKIADRLK
ncbi:hypothetical protein IGB42_03459 [Andreprevotia sp. IGB-42]|uniref:GlcG/HbpS family heme-binding protein n=1 Tax=Andreprevotia sp. IGB-42 TaxID=2497473 RepID=UPI001358D31C|nr:heme-binding protein [Andreprevotia sp. IGB-42]KAF0812181.1 hypothetical protein IGB42_03459 [Andreprevotia sp. IGB-42]